jgi:acyl carrier protein
MTKQEITDKIYEIVCNKFMIEKKEILPDSTFNSFGADSLDVIEVLIDIEKEFKINLPDNISIENFTIASVVDYIDELIFINKNK